MQSVDIHAVKAFLTENLPVYLQDLETLVNIDSGTFDKAGVDRVSSFLGERYMNLGAHVEVFPHSTYGDTRTATLQGQGVGHILLIGHTDTVYPLGTTSTRPFRMEGHRAYGPGVADMKSGDLCILYALLALEAVGARPYETLTVVHNSDEEVGSPSSRTLIRSKAAKADAVFVLEAGRENGAIVSARKGIADCRLTVKGRAAHAGVNHHHGRSAIVELAHMIVALEGLNGTIPGTTLNVGRVEGGGRINVVPDEAFAHFEIRSFVIEELENCISHCHTIAQHPTIPGTTAELSVSIEHQPMHKSAESQRLVERAQAVAHELDIAVHDTSTGGASDGNTAASIGKPVLDGLGPIGGSAHSPDEYIDISSIVPRTTLLTGLIASAVACLQ